MICCFHKKMTLLFSPTSRIFCDLSTLLACNLFQTYNSRHSFYSAPTCSPYLLLPSMTKQLLPLWVMWLDSVFWVLWRPRRQICGGRWDGYSSVRGYGADESTAHQDNTVDDRVRLQLGGLCCLLHVGESKVGSRLSSQGRVFLTGLCFESTRTWHMPQIVCSQHAAAPRSVLIGDRVLLSAAESACAMRMCVFVSVCFHVCMCPKENLVIAPKVFGHLYFSLDVW